MEVFGRLMVATEFIRLIQKKWKCVKPTHWDEFTPVHAHVHRFGLDSLSRLDLVNRLCCERELTMYNHGIQEEKPQESAPDDGQAVIRPPPRPVITS